MAITRLNPNTVFLAGDRTQVNDLEAGETITPGHLVERYIPSGSINRWRKHATAGGNTAMAVATDQAMVNKGVDDTYAAGDLMEVSILHKGATAWMLIASGVTANFGTKLESAGDGTLRALASGTALATAIESKGAVVALTRIRVEAL